MSSSSRGNGIESSSSRSRRRRRPPTPPPPPPPPPPPSTAAATAEEYEEMNEGGVWPEPFVEGVATQVAYDVSLSHGSGGRLSVAPSLALLFQVCSTWRAISRSELLWQNLVRIVWDRTTLFHPTWRDQYIYHHQTARNFRVRRCSHHLLHPTDHLPAAVPGGVEEEGGAADQLPLFCLRLELSNDHLAAGFSDGSVRLFYLPTRLHLRTVYPLLRDRLGLYSRAVSGLILGVGNHRLVFASLDGDIHVVSPLAGLGPARRACLGDVVNDGALVDFSGCGRFWVGLYAGVPGGAFRVWDAESEELLFVGGSLTDPESVMGWHMLTELRPAEFVARVRVLPNGLAVGVTGRRLLVLDLNEQAVVVAEEAPRRGIIVGSTGVNNDIVTTVDSRGVARVRRVRSLEEMCRFVVAARGGGSAVLLRGLIGCMNDMYVILCVGGVIRVWDFEHGEYLYSLRERLEEASAIVASEQYVVASCNTTIHLWDFGA